ncbi:TIGR01777 family oxidoreductase [Planococcus salinus]|uniref:TIGR01777 family protein n=1 Tax=Planococcus salinus TaxID=1848460 RepID=A0A3M8P364_9BACL|nr:TIGR01777 family oxidoreductase [Planococcus salinus]RNF38165.1 TIGR01777 family protein [Planococcus salinus]
MKKKIAITGGTGFVGKELTNALLNRDTEVFILTRRPRPPETRVTYVPWLTEGAAPEKELEGIDAIINLSGSSINDGRWNEEQQKEIYRSRMTSTAEVLRIIQALEHKPKTLINASAIGVYAPSETITHTEHSQDFGTNFLAKTVHDWESLAEEAAAFGLRVAYGRFGIILGKNEGALPLMTLPYKLFAGGPVGSGNQWVSWVHVHDVARAIMFALDHEELKGPFNITAPDPKQMRDFGKEIAKALQRPYWIPVPPLALKLALGAKSQLVLEGQRVVPAVLERHGFRFMFPDLQSALADLYK